MEPSGNRETDVLVVGEAPGEHEDEEGRPFVGKAGKLLRDCFGELGMKLDRDALVTNALICRPPHNQTPDRDQIDYCRPNLLKTISQFKPRVIITLGRVALQSVLGPYWDEIDTMERWAGWKIPLDGFWVCPTYHPSYLLRMRNELLDRMFVKHIEEAYAIPRDSAPEIPDYSKQVRILFDEKEIYDAVRHIDDVGGWAAIDYETNCIKPELPKARIISCAISNGEDTISYPWSGLAIEATRIFLESKRTRKIASNLKFEDRWTRLKVGYVRNWGWDTMIAAHCLDNRQHICSIKFQAFIRLGVPAYNRTIEPYLFNPKGPYNREEEIDIKDLLTYGGLDALLEYKVAMQQRKEMGYAD